MAKIQRVDTEDGKSFVYQVGDSQDTSDLPEWAKNQRTGARNIQYDELRAALTAKGTPGKFLEIPVKAQEGLSLTQTFDKIRNVIYNWRKQQTRVDTVIKTNKVSDSEGSVIVIFSPFTHVEKSKEAA